MASQVGSAHAFFQFAQFADRTRHCFGGRGHFCVQPVLRPRRGLVSSQWNAYCRNQRIAEDHALEHFIEHDDVVPNDGLSVLVRFVAGRPEKSIA